MRGARRLLAHPIPSDVAEQFLQSVEHPFVLSSEMVATIPREHRVVEAGVDRLIAPMRWEPDGIGTIMIFAPDAEARFSGSDLDLARGIADLASLALGERTEVRRTGAGVCLDRRGARQRAGGPGRLHRVALPCDRGTRGDRRA